MVIDFVLAIALVLALVKGYSKGLVVAAFSVVGFFVGLAAALMLSSVVATRLADGLGYGQKWMPFIAFILVMLAVMFLVRTIAGFIQKTFEAVLLGWVNRIGGMLLYALLYCMVFSIVLFYLKQLHLVSDENTAKSITYPFLKELGPIFIDMIAKIIPAFKNTFADLKQFFGQFADDI